MTDMKNRDLICSANTSEFHLQCSIQSVFPRIPGSSEEISAQPRTAPAVESRGERHAEQRSSLSFSVKFPIISHQRGFDFWEDEPQWLSGEGQSDVHVSSHEQKNWSVIDI